MSYKLEMRIQWREGAENGDFPQETHTHANLRLQQVTVTHQRNTQLNKDPWVTLIFVVNYCVIALNPTKNTDNRNNSLYYQKSDRLTPKVNTICGRMDTCINHSHQAFLRHVTEAVKTS